MFAIVLATILQSHIGEFFDLASWINPDVAPKYTYGSDSKYNTNEIWVIRKDVPRVTDIRTIELPAFFDITRSEYNWETGEMNVADVTRSVKQPYWDGQDWYVGDSILPGEELDGDGYPGWESDAYEIPRSFEWYTSHANYFASHTRLKKIRDYTIVTNRLYVPRAHIFGPENQAAVISAFDGFFERSYYAGVGMSNEWDEAVYGPKDNPRDFRFDVDGGGFWYEPTNRVIDSRRLTEGKNIYRLFNTVWLAGNAGWGFKASRPFWGNDRMQWACSSFSLKNKYSPPSFLQDLGLTECVFDWQHGLVDFLWEDRIIPLCTAYYDHNDWGGGYYPYESENEILRDCLAYVWFGEPENCPYVNDGSRDPVYNRLGRMRYQELYKNYYSFTDIVTNLYPHSCDIMTNETSYTQSSRNFAEQLGLSCQALSLLDRSYYEVNGYYEFPTTNLSFTAYNTQHGTTHANVTIDIGRGIAYLGRTFTNDDISWNTYTNKYTMTTNSWTYGLHRSMYSKFSGTRDIASDTPLVLRNHLLMRLTPEAVINACESYSWIGQLGGPHEVDLYEVVRVGSGYLARGYFRVDLFRTEPVTIPLSVLTEITNATLDVDIEARRSYDVVETLEVGYRSIGGLNHPGPAAYNNNKVSTNIVLGVSGYSSCNDYNGNSNDPIDDVYGSYGFNSLYSTRLYDLSKNTKLPPLQENMFVLRTIKDNQRSYLGHDPLTHPESVIPIDEEDLNLIKTNLIFTSGQIEAAKIPDRVRLTVTVHCPESDEETLYVTVDSVQTVNQNGSDFSSDWEFEEASLPLDFARLNVRFHSENELGPSHPFKFNNWLGPKSFTGHSSYLQQVDWNWRTLKKTLEN